MIIGGIMKERIKNILETIRPEFNFDESGNFIMDGLLDSFDVVTLISMLEETFNVSIDGIDIIPENFINYNAIENLIHKSGE